MAEDIKPGQRAFLDKRYKDYNQRSAVADTLTGIRQHQLVRMFGQFCVQTGRRTLNGMSVADSMFLNVAQRRWQDLPAFCYWLMKQKGKKRGYISPLLVNEVAKVYEKHAAKACCERDYDADGNCDRHPLKTCGVCGDRIANVMSSCSCTKRTFNADFAAIEERIAERLTSTMKEEYPSVAQWSNDTTARPLTEYVSASDARKMLFGSHLLREVVRERLDERPTYCRCGKAFPHEDRTAECYGLPKGSQLY